MKKNLFILNNEKCFKKDNKIFCQNIEIKLLAEDLERYFNTSLILRSAKINPVHEIQNLKTSIASNIFLFLLKVLISAFHKNTRYLIISITPYTFLSSIILFLLRRKVFLYLRSDGKKEVNLILGKKFLIIYKIMENIMTKYSKVIVVNKSIVEGKECELVNPSSIDDTWRLNTSLPSLDKIKILYVGRLKIEKGIYSLISIFKELNNLRKDITLTLIGHGEKIQNLISTIILIPPISSKTDLIGKYDEHNIVVLPSFTEGHPRVLIESLARKRPIIIFEEIKHVKQNYNGVYVCKRNVKSFSETVNHIIKNYNSIQNQMEKNTYPTKDKFASQLKNIISD